MEKQKGLSIITGASQGIGAVIAAGLIVTREVPANTVVGGVPVSHIRNIKEERKEITNRKL